MDFGNIPLGLKLSGSEERLQDPPCHLPASYSQCGRSLSAPSSLPVPADGHTLIDTIRGSGDDIVELVGHASRT